MFLDEATIEVIAGKGGDGSASFRREKFIPKGGPDGGDGGKGGDVYLRVHDSIHGLTSVAAYKVFKAKPGEHGRGKKQTGAGGKDITIDVPPGTIVYQITDSGDQQLLDLSGDHPKPIRIATGGKGGLGNVHFASPTNRTPKEFTPGQYGDRKQLRLVVQRIADVGLVGLPNVGKSTLLSRISQARPKIANYPFTTLEPQLGMVEYHGNRFIVADIPGLIEGAAQGKGLGHEFLRHLARTTVLVHLLDAQSTDLERDYATVRAELEEYDQELAQKPEVIVVSRIDTLDEAGRTQLPTKIAGQVPILLSSATGEGLDAILDSFAKSLDSATRDSL